MNTKILVSSTDIENTLSQKLLGVTIDRKLDFHDRVSNLYKISECTNKCHNENLPSYAFKSKETSNESNFNVAI